MEQELGVLLDAVLVHSATRVAPVLVTQVQLVMLGLETQLDHARLKIGVASPGAALAAVGRKAGGKHPQWRAGMATIAVWPVGEQTATPKALAHQLRIGGVVDQVAGSGHLRAGLSAAQVAARIRRRRIKLQGL